MTIQKIRNFYFNKYLVTPFSKNKYFITYDFKHKAMWFRVPKAAATTIDETLQKCCNTKDYVYSSPVGYRPSMYGDYFKFAFVRNPITRFISAFKDEILRYNYFQFSEEEYQEMQDLDKFIGWVKTLDLQSCDPHLRLQTSLIDLNNIDFLGRVEYLDEDFQYVADQIGLEKENLGHHNSTQKIKPPNITEAQMADIANLYESDIRIFYPTERALVAV